MEASEYGLWGEQAYETKRVPILDQQQGVYSKLLAL